MGGGLGRSVILAARCFQLARSRKWNREDHAFSVCVGYMQGAEEEQELQARKEQMPWTEAGEKGR